MTDPSYIGLWLSRKGGKRHLIESEITDRLVTRCGREMKLLLHGKQMQPYDMPFCKTCQKRPYTEGGPVFSAEFGEPI